jgi:hypothetical protein
MSTPHILSREEILAAQDRRPIAVPAADWGGVVLVRGLSGHERDKWEIETQSNRTPDVEKNLENLRADLAARTIVGPDDPNADPEDPETTFHLLFSKADVEALGEKSAKPLDLIFEVASALSGVSNRDVQKLVAGLPLDQTVSTGSATPRRSTALAPKRRRG